MWRNNFQIKTIEYKIFLFTRHFQQVIALHGKVQTMTGWFPARHKEFDSLLFHGRFSGNSKESKLTDFPKNLTRFDSFRFHERFWEDDAPLIHYIKIAVTIEVSLSCISSYY